MEAFRCREWPRRSAMRGDTRDDDGDDADDDDDDGDDGGGVNGSVTVLVMNVMRWLDAR
jgi:hypothetical protein